MNTRFLNRALFSVACGLSLVGGLSAGLNAFASYGHTWASNQVVYFVNPQSAWVSQPSAIFSVQQAAAGWSDQTRANVQLVYGGTTTGASLANNGKNEVFFRNDANGSVIAET